MGIDGILNAGRTGLLAQQRAITTTGNNIANVNTPGYSRQRTILEAVPADAGYGVGVAGIEQVVDEFLEARLLGQATDAAGATTRHELLDAVQRLFPIGTASVGGALQEFFAAANDLATHPEDLAARTELLVRAGDLAGRLRDAAAGLAAIQRQADQRITTSAGDANRLLERVAELNRGIVTSEQAGGNADELRDQRRHALGELSKVLGIRTIEQDDGSVDVLTRSGVTLVSGTNAVRIEARPGTTVGLDGGPLTDVGVVAPDGSLISLGNDPGGELGARRAVRDQEIAATAADLDLLAVTLRDTVNAVQTNPAGRDLDGVAGAAFFAGTGAADFVVALTDPRGVAAAQSLDSGDNANALALVGLQSATHGALSGATLGDHFGALQSRIGSLVRSAADAATLQESLLANVSALRDAVSGVSLEEEFTDLIRFQRGFQAATQLISIGDRMLEELIGMVR
jgi:flagellar hook-associated protein 1 FlgK